MATSIATNTLLVPDIPKNFFTSQDALKTIRSQWETFGELHQLIPIKGFRRLMVIYLDTQCAIEAKKSMNHSILYWKETADNAPIILGLNNDGLKDSNTLTGPLYEMEVRVYFGQHNPINPDPASLSLQVPEVGRNLLISPPGDPCHQWEQRAESPPNKAILASDLLRALTTVDGDNDMELMDDFKLDDGPVTMETHDDIHNTTIDTAANATCLPSSSSSSIASFSPRLETPTLQLSFDHESLPTIMIQDMDGSLLSQHEQKTNKSPPSASSRNFVRPTARPPIST